MNINRILVILHRCQITATWVFILVLPFPVLSTETPTPPTITNIRILGGNGWNKKDAIWDYIHQIWDTFEPGLWILGVSATAGGNLLNKADGSINPLPLGTYWLYAEPTNLGENPRLDVSLSDGRILRTIFKKKGKPSVPNTWQLVSGSSDLVLGWAQGHADKVGTGVGPSGTNDYYLRVEVLNHVGGLVKGVYAPKITCRNITTGQEIQRDQGYRSWNCNKLGLTINHGDNILQTIEGIAE